MDDEQFKGLILAALQNANEDFARQALLALGHGYCSANAHPHSDRPFSADQRDPKEEEALQRAKDAEAQVEDHKARADAYAAWLARHHNALVDTANAVWTLLFQYGEEDRVESDREWP